MTNEKKYPDNCPTCNLLMQRRKRDIGKDCRKCLMSKVGTAWGEKRRANPSATAHPILQKRYRQKYKDDNARRLSCLLQQAKIRARKSGVVCDITLDDLLEIFPKDNKCPVFKTDLYWGSSGKGNRECSPSIDRKDATKGYTKGNIKIISWVANRKKSNSTIAELEALLNYMKA